MPDDVPTPARPPLPGAGPQARSYRPGTSWAYLGVYAAFGAWWVIALVVGGHWGDLARVLPGLLAVGLVLWTLLWRPAVSADPHGVLLRNVVHDVAVPWSAVDAVETRFALTVVSAGRSFSAWAAPTRSGLRSMTRAPRPPDAGPDVLATAASRSLDADSGAAAYLVEQFRSTAAAPADGDPVAAVVRPAWSALIALAVAVLLGALALL